MNFGYFTLRDAYANHQLLECYSAPNRNVSITDTFERTTNFGQKNKIKTITILRRVGGMKEKDIFVDNDSVNVTKFVDLERQFGITDTTDQSGGFDARVETLYRYFKDSWGVIRGIHKRHNNVLEIKDKSFKNITFMEFIERCNDKISAVTKTSFDPMGSIPMKLALIKDQLDQIRNSKK